MNRISVFSFALAICLASGIVYGQVKTVERVPKTGTIKGRVVAAETELGLSNATITVFAQDGGNEGEPRVARTNENGDYEIIALKAGRYTVMASRTGYLSHLYGHKLPGGFPEGPGTPVRVSEGEALGDINFRLVGYGVVEGRVVDASGEPMTRATVELSQYRSLGGKRRLVSRFRGSRTQTDDRGRSVSLRFLPAATISMPDLTTR